MDMGMTTQQIANTGKWTHLPPLPWKYLGCTIEKWQACPGSPVQCGAACDHCGTAIMETHRFRGADDATFVVGSTCVGKMIRELKKAKAAPDPALRRAEMAIKDERNRKSRERAKVKRIADREAATLLLEEKRGEADALPHPRGFTDRDTGRALSLYDWADWMLAHGGGNACRQVLAKLSTMGV